MTIPQAPHWKDDGFLRALAAPFAVRQAPQPLPQPHWVARNDALADALGWHGWLDSGDALALLSGNAEPPGGTLASVYSGHQFGVWAGQLGDGRALLVGEADTALGPMEVQVKGAGLTPYSRMGDGRAVLRSSIREYLCSEAMHGLNIPTTRALALAGSPLPVRRETVETAAVVTRVAPSFLRFGHFEHFAHTAQDVVALQRLADAARERYFPGVADARGLLEDVARRSARLLAQWQAVGFCHGVMNTDNMSLLGLTIDYGPFGFLDGFDPGHVCNHSDHQGRYAYARQPNVAFWNLHALAQALLPLIEDDDAARDAVDAFKPEFAAAMLGVLRAKLGLRDARDEDGALADDLLRLMAAGRSDFTLTFRALATPAAARDHFIDRDSFDAWNVRYAARLAGENSDAAERALRMNAVNPKYILRNHLAETAIRRATEGDFSEVGRLLRVLQHPFDDQPENAADAALPPDWAQHLEVSCSS